MSAELLQRRRRLLLGAIGAALGGLAVGGTAAQPLTRRSGLALPAHFADAGDAAQFWAQPRVVNLVRTSTGEHRRVCYWRDGHLDRAGYREVCHVLRDVRAGQTVAMDLQLLNTLCGMQGWLYSAYGYQEPYNITSGYRSAHTNATTEGAAKNSLHTQGKACDGRFPQLPGQYVGQLAAMFQSGGVGFYLDKRNFIHTDVGRVRSWTVR